MELERNVLPSCDFEIPKMDPFTGSDRGDLNPPAHRPTKSWLVRISGYMFRISFSSVRK
jgi:hypothetical protein